MAWSPRVRAFSVAGVVVCFIAAWPQRTGERPIGPDTYAIAALKTITSAEVAYAAVYGHYDTLDCLAYPRCDRSKPATQEGFLNVELAATKSWHGFQLDFFPGVSSGDPSESATQRLSLSGFAVTATPLQSAGRAFCADHRGLVFVTAGGVQPRLEGGRCVDVGDPLR